jgi:hypothetical protein
VAERHAEHDPLLVAAFAAGDVEATELGRAEALITSCGECSILAADLRVIARATAELPAPHRPRDFFVRPADAERLRPGGLRRLAAAVSGARIRVARPLAAGLMMVGFAGLVVAALPEMSRQAASAPPDQRIAAQASPTPESDIAGGRPLPAAGEPAASGDDLQFGGADQGTTGQPGAAGSESAPSAPAETKASPGVAASGPSVLTIGSLALALIGAALFLSTLLRTGTRPR